MADGTQTEVSLTEFCEGFERAYMNNAVAAFENADFSSLTQIDINNLLNKGYSLVYKGNKLIKDISSLSLDDEIIIKTGNGKIVARIIDLKKE